MADVKDIATVVASALEEVSMSGKVDVTMDGNKAVVPIGDEGDAVLVKIVVEEIADKID